MLSSEQRTRTAFISPKDRGSLSGLGVCGRCRDHVPNSRAGSALPASFPVGAASRSRSTLTCHSSISGRSPTPEVPFSKKRPESRINTQGRETPSAEMPLEISRRWVFFCFPRFLSLCHGENRWSPLSPPPAASAPPHALIRDVLPPPAHHGWCFFIKSARDVSDIGVCPMGLRWSIPSAFIRSPRVTQHPPAQHPPDLAGLREEAFPSR